jgi:hypothetical protein
MTSYAVGTLRIGRINRVTREITITGDVPYVDTSQICFRAEPKSQDTCAVIPDEIAFTATVKGADALKVLNGAKALTLAERHARWMRRQRVLN